MRSTVVALAAALAGLALSACVDEGAYVSPSRYPVAQRDDGRYDSYERDRYDDRYGRYDPPPRYDPYDRYDPSRRYGRYDPPRRYDPDPVFDDRRPRAYRRPVYDRPDEGRPPEGPRGYDRPERVEREPRRESRGERPEPPVPPPGQPQPQPSAKPSLAVNCSGEGEARKCRLQGNNAFRQ